MLKNLIRSSTKLTSQKTAKWSELSGFICQRALLTKEETASVNNKFEALAQQYNISKQDVTQAIAITSINLDTLQKNIGREFFFHEKEIVVQRYADSQYYSLGRTPQETRNALVQQFPDLANPASYGYDGAIQDLKSIFVFDPVTKTNIGAGNFKAYAENIDQYISDLRKKHEQSGLEINQKIELLEHSLNEILAVIKKNSNYYARVVTRVDSLPSEVSAPATVTSSKSVINPEEEAAFKVATREDKLNLSHELTSEIRDSRNSYLLPFTNDRKVIFETSIRHAHSLRWRVLAGVLGAATLYLIWQGDAKYKTIIVVPTLALALAVWGHRNAMQNGFQYLKEVAIYKDGKRVDLTIQSSGTLTKFQAVPISQLKLFRKDLDFPVEEAEQILSKETEKETHFSKIRQHFGLTGNLLRFNDNHILVPNLYNGNDLILNRVFEGKEVNAEEI